MTYSYNYDEQDEIEHENEDDQKEEKVKEIGGEQNETPSTPSIPSTTTITPASSTPSPPISSPSPPPPTPPTTPSSNPPIPPSLQKERPYPLFLLEKAADVLDEASQSFTTFVSTLSSENALPPPLQTGTRPKVVVLGTGWGAASYLKTLSTTSYEVTVISPRNFFLFTPMLAGAAVGTVEYRSITEAVRKLNSNMNFLEATATSVDTESKTIECESVVCEGNSCTIDSFTVPYDYAIVTIGAATNTFGIPGVRENCNFLKQISDARRIRTSIVNCFERANLPGLTETQKRATLTFAVIGAGPTGVEFASELRDFVEQDGPVFYPHLLPYVRIKVIEASSTILAPFDKSLQESAIASLTRKTTVLEGSGGDITELLLDSGVAEVKSNVILLNDGREIPYGLSVWAAGNGPMPLTLSLIDAIGGEQKDAQPVARGRLAVDGWCRVKGTDGTLMAFGDCSCQVENQLPATAQVASQQGEYLAKLFSRGYDFTGGLPGVGVVGCSLPPPLSPSTTSSLAEKVAGFATGNTGYAVPFQFLNLGILAYTGAGSALAQVQLTPDSKRKIKGTGQVGFGIWRSVYLSKQVSGRNRLLVLVDWVKAKSFGRDITRL